MMMVALMWPCACPKQLTENMEKDYSKGVQQRKPVKTGPKNPKKNLKSKNDSESDDSDDDDTDGSDASDDIGDLSVEVKAKNDAMEAVSRKFLPHHLLPHHLLPPSFPQCHPP